MKPQALSPHRGTTFTRYIKSLAIARGNVVGAMAYARSQNWENEEAVVTSLKALVTAEGIADWGLGTPAVSDFVAFVRPLSLTGKLIGLRQTPSRVRSIAATSGSGAFWAGEKNPRALSKMQFSAANLEPLSVISEIVITRELAQSSSPQVEPILSRDLAAAMVAAMDSAFISHSSGGVAGVMPASITYGTTAIHSTGNLLAQIDADLALMIEKLMESGSDMNFATFVMRPRTALFLSRLRGSGGALAYPGMGVKGGTILGLPCITSASVPVDDIGSPYTGTSQITLLDPSQVLVVDDGGATLEASAEASILMDDGPGSPSSEVSMFQTESVILKSRRLLNWRCVRSGVAQVLDQVAY